MPVGPRWLIVRESAWLKVRIKKILVQIKNKKNKTSSGSKFFPTSEKF